MADSNELTVDQLLAQELSGREKLRALLVARFGSIQAYARKRSRYPEQVTMTLSGARGYPDVRDELSEDLEIPRAEIDVLIDTPAPAEGAV